MAPLTALILLAILAPKAECHAGNATRISEEFFMESKANRRILVGNGGSPSMAFCNARFYGSCGGGTPANILLNCGAPSSISDESERIWDTDDPSKYAPPNAAALSQSSKASHMLSSVSQVPYDTARVFQSPFTYTFPVLTGSKFLRLYFYPNIYSNFNTSHSFFSLSANEFTLLSNFSAFLNSQHSQEHAFMKEFIINVQGNQRLNLTFSPNRDSFAFINGIEIVSIPDKLYFRGDGVEIKFFNQVYYLNNNSALEKLYRLNVGGNYVGIQDDNIFRAWKPDNNYILHEEFSYMPHREDLPINYTPQTPPYSAPEIVYQTSRVLSNGSIRLDWDFSVDSGFYYLLRLHFCEIALEVTRENERVFTILINNQTAEIKADVFRWTHGRGIPIFNDYIVFVPDDGRRGKKNMLLTMLPNREDGAYYFQVLLNGLEIFKISDRNRSLAAANSDLNMIVSPLSKLGEKKTGKRPSPIIYAGIGSASFVLIVLAAASFLTFRRQKKVKDSTSRSTAKKGGSGKPMPSNPCRYFSLKEIKAATKNFKPDFIIGRGGFGTVYKGHIDGGATAVAIKRLNTTSNQGAREFLTEIEMLTRLRHLHLVSLIGYSDDNGEMILVYDYMSHGTLRDHLYNSDNPPLGWKQRLRICLGAARGLHYLHTGASPTIIHRDVKSTNILLDEKWVSKVSDFGLSKEGPTAGGADTHVTTVVKGSFGYVDPEYYRWQHLTEKSDVYSFGVVLLEILCARPVIIPSLPMPQVNLAEWVKLGHGNGTMEQIVDSNLDGQIAPECLEKYVETAVACIKDKGIERPLMNDVVWSLESAMQLQEAAEHGDVGGSTMSPFHHGGFESSNPDDNIFFGTSGNVFSEIVNPMGR